MNAPSKLAKVLIAIFVVSLLALVAQILFILWRRQILSSQDSTNNCVRNRVVSKDLLYFFCLKTESRVEPVGVSDEATGLDDSIDVFKLRDMSRILFTIKEEEEEGLESQNSVSSVTSKSTDDTRIMSQTVLVITEENNEDDIGSTPYLTPCVSPSSLTPVASPATHQRHSEKEWNLRYTFGSGQVFTGELGQRSCAGD